MLNYVWKLLRARWRITFNNMWRASGRRKIGLILIGFGLVALAAFLVFISRGALSLLRRPEAAQFVTPDLVRAVPVLFTSATFLVGLLTNFGALLQTLYLAGDMEFLLAAPVPPRAVFVAKLVQAVLPNFLFMSLFNLPALVGLGLAQGYNATYFVMLPVTLVLLMLAGGGLAAMVVMTVVRFIPARRVAEVLGLIGGLVSVLCSQSSQIMRVSGMGRASSSQMLALASAATRFDTPYSPLAWPGRALVALGEGQWLAALLFVGLTVTLTGGAFAAALVATERLYVSGWARTQPGATPHKAARGAITPRSVERRRATGAGRLFPAPFVALVVKDSKVLRRDLRNLSQLVTPIVFGVVYTLSLARSVEGAPSTLLGSGLVTYGGLGTAIFVAWMFSARLAMGGISMEGKQYWLLKVAPLRPEVLLAAKFVVAYLPSLALGSVFLTATTLLGRSLETLAYSWIAFAATVAALCAMYLAFGTAGANLNWENPRQMMGGVLGCVGSVVGMAAAGIIAGVFVGVPTLLAWFGAPALLTQAAGLGIGLILCAGIMIVTLLWARGRVAWVGE